MSMNPVFKKKGRKGERENNQSTFKFKLFTKQQTRANLRTWIFSYCEHDFFVLVEEGKSLQRWHTTNAMSFNLNGVKSATRSAWDAGGSCSSSDQIMSPLVIELWDLDGGCLAHAGFSHSWVVPVPTWFMQHLQAVLNIVLKDTGSEGSSLFLSFLFFYGTGETKVSRRIFNRFAPSIYRAMAREQTKADIVCLNI